MEKYFAHKTDDGRFQTIADHAQGTEKLAEAFADSFGFAYEAGIAGRFHDIGKYSKIFQRRLAGSNEKYEHSSAGMYLFLARVGPGSACIYADMLVAHVIAGHHSGLPDTGSKSDTELEATLFGKKRRRETAGTDFEAYKNELGELPPLNELPPEFLPSRNCRDRYFSYQFLGRMLFSALVDADFLDTERFMSDGGVARDGGEDFDRLIEKFDRYMTENFMGKTGKLNENRAQILGSCRKTADQDKGIYRLTVPTGGGKTLSSMAFALGHLKKHGMKRIIYVIPYVSIIRQTVAKFEEIFGKENVLGHYSTADYSTDENGERSAAELASENWDKPIIVTTNVQFFESLFSNRTSSCRKLHNIVDSVLIFDEAQMLPVGLLRPCLRSIVELVRNYRCTALLCTATQPALESLLAENSVTASEICPDVETMYSDFARVRYEKLGKVSDDEIGERLLEAGSALCVLNSRMGARTIYERLRGDGVYHLSTYMTPEHLGETIKTIRQRLADKKRCIVISTSLIEAGVDVDFPTVFRENAGLDSIIQAGGRCNREGKNPLSESVVFIFSREEAQPRFDEVKSITNRISELYDDISSPEAIHEYFARLYRANPLEKADRLDKKDILGLITHRNGSDRGLLPYQEIASRFRYIDKEQKLVLIPNANNTGLCDAVRSGRLSRRNLRDITRDSVGLYHYEFEQLKNSGVLSAECGGIAVLEDKSWYNRDCGLMFKETGEAVFG